MSEETRFTFLSATMIFLALVYIVVWLRQTFKRFRNETYPEIILLLVSSLGIFVISLLMKQVLSAWVWGFLVFAHTFNLLFFSKSDRQLNARIKELGAKIKELEAQAKELERLEDRGRDLNKKIKDLD